VGAEIEHMLTLFAIPKPFRGHIAIIQRNAIKSWTLLRPQCEIILFGDDEGTAEVASEFGVRHVSQVARNEFGTPLLNDIFEQAQRLASHKLLCYVNADIVLMSEFLPAAERVCRWRDTFLIIGRRWDIGIDKLWDFAPRDWGEKLRRYVLEHGKLRGEHAVDYFVFPKGLYDDVPPFAIGRFSFDSWLIFKAISSGHPVVDATGALMIAHQNHDYAHLSIPDEQELSWNRALRLDEFKLNYELLGGEARRFGVGEATHVLTVAGECKRKYFCWRLEIIKRRFRHELLTRTRPLRHLLGLRESNLRRLKRALALTFVKPNWDDK
jgi:hypothetical protein